MKCRSTYALYIHIYGEYIREKDAAQIKSLATSKSEPVIYYSKKPARVPHKKKDRTGVLTSSRQNEKICQSIMGTVILCAVKKRTA